VYENLMIDMMLTNEKLAERAVRILGEASGKSVSAAEQALRAAGHDLRLALVMLKRRIGAGEARRSLKAAGGDLREAFGGAKNRKSKKRIRQRR
jgi:N-acetylmuramic acid 6-phosphate etherase